MMLLLLLLLLSISISAAVPITSCGELASGVYELSSDIVGDSICLTINGDVVLEGKGKSVEADVPVLIKEGSSLVVNDITFVGNVIASSAELEGNITLEGSIYSNYSNINVSISSELVNSYLGSFFSSEVIIRDSNISSIFYEGPIFYVERSNLSIEGLSLFNVFSDALLFNCSSGSVVVARSIMDPLPFSSRDCDVEIKNTIFRGLEQRYFSGLENASVEGNFSILEIENSKNITISANTYILKIKDSEGILLNFSNVASEILLINSKVSSYNSRFRFPNLMLNSSVFFVNDSIFCSPISLDSTGESDLVLNHNAYSEISRLYDLGLIQDSDSDFVAEGKAVPLGPPYSSWDVEVYDPSPVFAGISGSCSLEALDKERSKNPFSSKISFDCNSKTLTIEPTLFSLPTSAEAILISKTPPLKSYKEKGTGKITIEVEDYGTYSLTLRRPAYKEVNLLLNLFACGDLGEEAPLIEDRVKIIPKIPEQQIVVGESATFSLETIDGTRLPETEVLVVAPYTNISLRTDEEGKFTFIPLESGTYSFVVPGKVVLEGATIFAKEKKEIFVNELPFNLKQEGKVTINPISSKPISYSLEIEKNSTLVVNNTNLSGSYVITLPSGEYLIRVISEEDLDGISVALLSNGDVWKRIYSAIDVLFPILFILFLFFLLKSRNYRYKARYEFSGDLLLVSLKDFYNMPAKGIELKLLKDGELVGQGITDDYGRVVFRLEGKGTYVLTTKRGRVYGGKFKL